MSRKRIDAAMDEIIDFSGLDQFIDVPVKVYSSGMYVRLGFAIAVTLDPEILVIDEIIAVGDEEFQRRCFDHLHRLRRRGVTIVFVTHSMSLVNQLCDGAAWLEHGKLKLVGTASEVVDAYMAEVNAAESERLSHEHTEDAGSVSSGGAHDAGTGEVVIDRVEFLDSWGQVKQTGQTGSAMTVRLRYSCAKPMQGVVFGLSIIHEGGTEVAGPNTLQSGLPAMTVDGKGYVDYVLDPLPLSAGRYYLHVAAVDESLLHAYDFWNRAADLTVQPGPGPAQNGLVVLDGHWNHTSE